MVLCPAFRIRMFLGLLDPDPSSNKQKTKINHKFYFFATYQ